MSKQARPFAKLTGEYQQVSNHIFRLLMPTMAPTNFVALCYFMDRTIGRGVRSFLASYGEIRAGTGIKSDATLSKAIRDLEDRGLIQTQKLDLKWARNRYAINVDFALTIDEQPASKNEVEESEQAASKFEVDSKQPTSKNEAVSTSNFEVGPPDSCNTWGKDYNPPRATGENPDPAPPETARLLADMQRLLAAWPDHPHRDRRRPELERWFLDSRPTPDLVEEILRSIERHKQGASWQDGYIHIPVNWLREEGWKQSVVMPRPRPTARPKTIAEEVEEIRQYRETHGKSDVRVLFDSIECIEGKRR